MKKRVLVIGNATLDVVSVVDRYPEEDSEVRSRSHQWRLGGNAANTANVLVQLGYRVDWAGVLADDLPGRWIADNLEKRGIGIEYARVTSGNAPVSCVTIDASSGSRTIVHHRDLPELAASNTRGLDCTRYDWVHFEGRNIEVIAGMLEAISLLPTSPGISLEAEKPRERLNELFPWVDMLLVGRHWALSQRYGSAREAVEQLSRAICATVVCAWGDEGACASVRSGHGVCVPAYQPGQVVDTLGAGDVFNAAMIDATLRELSLIDSLKESCRLAGVKCGQQGIDEMMDDDRFKR